MSFQVTTFPLFPITINGNKSDTSKPPASDASSSNYIIVQCWGRLLAKQWNKLEEEGLRSFNVVSRNTYLCYYRSSDLEKIQQMELVVYADVYRPELKITPDLLLSESDQDFKVDVIFHNGGQFDTADLERNIVEKTESHAKVLKTFSHKTRCILPGRYIQDVAALDEVCCIEKVRKLMPCNDRARQILRADQHVLVSNERRLYEGEGQVVAIADSSFDNGDKHAVHPAFEDRFEMGDHVQVQSRIEELICLGDVGRCRDTDGHGTHLCGCIAGNGRTSKGEEIKGIAPKARLVVQCAGRDFNIPDDRSQLFEVPFRDHNARVHCDAWGDVPDALDNVLAQFKRSNRQNPVQCRCGRA